MRKGRKKKILECKFKARRLVEINVIAEELFCSKCPERIYLENIENEKLHHGMSIFQIKCLKCLAVTDVHTGKTHEVPAELVPASEPRSSTKKSVTHSDTTEMLILGIFLK